MKKIVCECTRLFPWPVNWSDELFGAITRFPWTTATGTVAMKLAGTDVMEKEKPAGVK
jgi:hypothetical protein